MSTYTWKNANSGDWSVASDWSPATAPNAATSDAVISASGSYAVGIASGETFTADSLLFTPGAGGTLAVQGVLNLAGKFQTLPVNSGDIYVGGSVSGGTIFLSGADLIGAGGALSNVTLLGIADPNGVGSSELLTNGMTLQTITADIGGNVPTTGLTNSTLLNSTLIDSGSNATITLTNDILQGSSIGENGNTSALSVAGGSLQTTTVSASGGVVQINIGNAALVQTSTLAVSASSETINLTNGVTLLNSAININSSAGTLLLDNTTMQGGGISVAGSGVRINLTDGVTLHGGTIHAGGGGQVITLTNGAGPEALIGYGTLYCDSTASLTNNGIVEVNGGRMVLAGGWGFGVNGTGGFKVDAGAVLELGGSVSSGQTVTLAGVGSTLQMDASTAFAGTIAALSPGETIDLAGTVATKASVSGNSLVVTFGPNNSGIDPVITYALSAPAANDLLTLTSDGAGGTDVIVQGLPKVLAQAGTILPGSVNFGIVHTGGTIVQALTIANQAPAAGKSENLDATLTASGMGISASGTIAALAPGQTDTSHLTIGLNTGTAGIHSGTATVTLTSDGTGVDGGGLTALGTQTIAVAGTVYAYATPLMNSGTINLGAVRVGGPALTGTASLANGTTASAYQESLIYSLGAVPAGLVIGNGSGTIASGGTAAIGVTLAGTTAGSFTGTTDALSLTSTGAGTSGLANTALAGQTLTVNGKVYAAAIATLGTNAVNFGIVHVGDTVSRGIAVTNTATGALTDVLINGTDTLTGYAGTVAFAPGAGVTAGNSGTVTLGLSTAAAGTVSGTAALGFGSHDSDLSDLAIQGGAVSVTGTVDNYAAAKLELTGGPGTLTGSGNAFVLNLGTEWQGGAMLVTDLGVLNGATGAADALSGSFAISGSNAYNDTGFTAFSGLAAGQDEENQVIILHNNTAGVFSQTVTLTPTSSNASGYSGVMGNETLTVTGTVIASTYQIGSAPITLHGIGNDTIVAVSGALNSADSIDGGTGINTLVLSGGGKFDLGAPAQLINVQTIDMTEGQLGASYTALAPAVYLRNGLNATVNVGSGTPVPGNTKPETVTIYGATNSDVINLGAGSDTVIMNGTGETVNSGGGIALIQASAAYAGVLVNGGTAGTTTLEITSGGTATLNALTTGVNVKLDAATNLTLSGMGFVAATGSTGADTITAGAANQTLTGNGGADTLVGYSGFGDTFKDTLADFNGVTIKQFGGSDVIDITNEAFSALKPLTYSGTSTAGTLTVTDGTHTAKIAFAGSYTTSNFTASTDGASGTFIKLH